MKAMDEGFYKMNTEVRLAVYEKVESEQCNWCKYRDRKYLKNYNEVRKYLGDLREVNKALSKMK